MKGLIKTTRELLAPSREVIPLTAVGPRVHHNHEDVVDAEVVKDWSVWVKSIKALMVVTLGIIIGFHVVDVINFMKGMRPPEQHQIAVQPEATMEIAVPPSASIGHKGVLTWDKPDGIDGLNPKQRSLTEDVMINRNDKNVMDLTTSQGTRILWNKENPCGRWWKEGGPSGQWCMQDDDEGRSFSGEISDNLGNRIPATFEVSD